MNTKNFAICLKSNGGFSEGGVYELDFFFERGGVYELDFFFARGGGAFTLKNNIGRLDSVLLNDEHFCFVLNATPEIEAKLKGGER